MKKIHYILCTLLACTVVVQAVIIDVNSAANTTAAGNQGSASSGTLTCSTLIFDNSTPPQNQQFTISGLTLDATGTADDSVVVNFIVSGVGGNLQTSGSSGPQRPQALTISSLMPSAQLSSLPSQSSPGLTHRSWTPSPPSTSQKS